MTTKQKSEAPERVWLENGAGHRAAWDPFVRGEPQYGEACDHKEKIYTVEYIRADIAQNVIAVVNKHKGDLIDERDELRALAKRLATLVWDNCGEPECEQITKEACRKLGVI